MRDERNCDAWYQRHIRLDECRGGCPEEGYHVHIALGHVAISRRGQVFPLAVRTRSEGRRIVMEAFEMRYPRCARRFFSWNLRNYLNTCFDAHQALPYGNGVQPDASTTSIPLSVVPWRPPRRTSSH